jgi:hypothetical protein
MTTYTIEIQAGDDNRGWQAMEPAETVETGTDDWPGQWTAAEVAQAIADNQDVAEAPYRVAVWAEVDADTGTEPTFVLDVEPTANRDSIAPGLAAWLGPALDQLTDAQIGLVADASRAINDRYPDPDEEHLRDAALSAAVQYLLGDTSAEEAKRRLAEARAEEAMASAAAQQVAVMLVGEGMFEIPAAAAVGITRTTLRRALGKDA